MKHRSDPPPAHDPGADEQLDLLVRHLIAVGEHALVEDEVHGPDWGVYADWAWRTGTDALGSSPTDVRDWLDTDASSLEPTKVAAVLDAISRVHCDAGLADPTVGVRP